MKNANNQVSFRRIRGRIVPIKRSDKTTADRALGVLSLGAGLSSIALGASSSVNVIKKSAYAEHAGRAVMDVAKSVPTVTEGSKKIFLAQQGRQLIRASNILHKFRYVPVAAGALVGAGFIGLGAKKLSNKKDEANNFKEAFGTAVALTGIATYFALSGNKAKILSSLKNSINVTIKKRKQLGI